MIMKFYPEELKKKLLCLEETSLFISLKNIYREAFVRNIECVDTV